MTKRPFNRPVPPLDPAIWKDAHDYLLANNEEILNSVYDSVEAGYTAGEIYHHWLREAGLHREELARRCMNAAKHIKHTSEGP